MIFNYLDNLSSIEKIKRNSKINLNTLVPSKCYKNVKNNYLYLVSNGNTLNNTMGSPSHNTIVSSVQYSKFVAAT